MKEQKQNCWDFKNCGRGPDAKVHGNDKPCPVATERRLDGIHDGMNSGRACWAVAGTLCGGKVQGTYAEKHDLCQKCEFYKQVALEEGEGMQRPLYLLDKLKEPAKYVDVSNKKLGVLIGGSGLIGGTLNHYFKTVVPEGYEILSPNIKKLSLRESEDIKQYFKRYRPDFIINCAIASLDSDEQLSYEINYLGSINLAKVAMALRIPYIHFSSAATLPNGEDITENQLQTLTSEMTNYAKSKLMAEKTLQHLHETRGLDYTIIKLGIVYGEHDHKIQGFHKMLFTIAKQSMQFMFTSKGILHSYTHSKKVPPFVHYILERREEFSGQTYHFVDHNPVELSELILTIKSYLNISVPKEFYVSYPVARFVTGFLKKIVKGLNKVGIEARLPAEMMFMENCYYTQTLSTKKLRNSSFGLPTPEKSIFTELPTIVEYYIRRWEHLNLIKEYNICFYDPLKQAQKFSTEPSSLLEEIHSEKIPVLEDFEELREPNPTAQSSPSHDKRS